MDRNEILELYLEAKKKELKIKSLAENIGCSQSLLSQFFNFKCNLSPNKEQLLKRVINEAKEFEWKRVPIE